MQPTIFMGTIDRGAQNYVEQSVAYAFSDPSVAHLHLLVGSPQTDYLGNLRNDPRITLHLTTDEEWAALTPVPPAPHIQRQRRFMNLPPAPKPSPHVRQSWNMCRAFDGDHPDGVIVLEDDIQLVNDWYRILTEAAAEIAERSDRDSAYLLTGFASYYKELRVTDRYGRIPGPFYMSQCVYLSAGAVRRRDAIRDAAKRMPFDLALNYAGHENFVLPFSIVNHVGDLSTMGNPPGRSPFRWRN